LRKRRDDNIRAMPTTVPSIPSEPRTNDLIAWVESEFASHGRSVNHIEALPSAASFRRFLRVHDDDHSCIAMDAPPARENNAQFVRLADLFGNHGIPVPSVLGSDLRRGFLLVSDLGDRHLQDVYGTDAEAPAIEAALDVLIRIQSLPYDMSIPLYTEERMREEFELFPDWLLTRLLGVGLSHSDRALLATTRSLLIEAMTAQPTCCVHRDFHCQNLLWRGEQGLGIVDFQDALWGPSGYDLASLLRDCYHRFRETDVDRWRNRYVALARAAGLPWPADESTFRRQIDWTALQRQIKAIGIFARLHERDGRDRHLHDILPVMAQIIDAASRYEELTPFADWMAEHVRPAAERVLAPLVGTR